MKKTSLRIIKLALTVQFLGVLAVPALLASNDSPRAMWMAEWLNASDPAAALSPVAREREGRTIGVLKLRDGKLTFTEQIGQVDWEIDLASVKRVVSQGRAVAITTMTEQEFTVGIMDSSFTPVSPKKVTSAIERAIQFLAANSR
jgi:hypothetical protein